LLTGPIGFVVGAIAGCLSAIAWIVESASGEILTRRVEVIGNVTKNQAEYRTMIRGPAVRRQYRARRVRCFADSELVIKQLKGTYTVRSGDLRLSLVSSAG
jgi:ribonuclease HI